MGYTKWQKLIKRRRMIVDREFQFDLMFRLACYSLFMMVVLGVGLFLPILNGLEANGPDLQDSATTMLYMHQHFWPVAILCAVLGFLWSLRISHKIAGPLVRVKRSMNQIGEGRLPKVIVTRSGDYMQAEVSHLNRMTEALDRRIEKNDQAIVVLLQALKTLQEGVGSTLDPELQASLDLVKESVDRLVHEQPLKRNQTQSVAELSTVEPVAVGLGIS